MQNVPFIDLKRWQISARSEILSEWTRVFDQTEFVGGASVQKLEAELATKLNVNHVVSCANGTDAILIALQAYGIGPGKKVAMPDMTFWATYEAIAQLGAETVFIDINPDDLQMDFSEFQKAWDIHRFEAAILPHLFGWATAQLKEYRAFCRERSIVLVEDGAQCFGVQVDDQSVYHAALIGTLSFYPAKVLGGPSDGGAVVIQDEAIARRVRSLCNHGRKDHYSYEYVGWNSRMSGLCASYLLQMLKSIDAAIDSRLNALSFYEEELINERGLRFFCPPAGQKGNGYLCVLTLSQKDSRSVAAKLKELGVGTAHTYPSPLNKQSPVKNARAASDLMHARDFCARVLNLPLFAGIEAAETEYVIQKLRQCL